MVKTHEATRSSPATVGDNRETSPKICTSDMDNHQTKGSISATSATEASAQLEDDSEEDGEGYTNGEERRPARVIGRGGGGGGPEVGNNGLGNYAMGSQCLDSGMLLRQGISLWARSSSPADAVEVVATVTTTAPGNASAPLQASVMTTATAGGGGNNGGSRPYVNLQNTRPSASRTPLGRQHQTSGPSPASGASANAGVAASGGANVGAAKSRMSYYSYNLFFLLLVYCYLN